MAWVYYIGNLSFFLTLSKNNKLHFFFRNVNIFFPQNWVKTEIFKWICFLIFIIQPSMFFLNGFIDCNCCSVEQCGSWSSSLNLRYLLTDYFKYFNEVTYMLWLGEANIKSSSSVDLRFGITFWKFLAVSLSSFLEEYLVTYVKSKSDLRWERHNVSIS